MKKFSVLLFKELRELVNLQLILPLILVVAIFIFIGSFMGDIMKETATKEAHIAVMDKDNSDLSKSLIETLKKTGNDIYTVEATEDTTAALKKAKDEGYSSLIIFPKDFANKLVNDKTAQQLEVITSMKSFSLAATFDSTKKEQTVSMINDIISTSLISKNISGADPTFIKNPVVTKNVVEIAGKKADVSPDALMGLVMSQSLIIPIIMFIIIMMSSQTIATAIVNEKSDKTLETLLSTPVPRSVVLTAKMAASGLVSLVFAIVYLFGMSFYMNGLTGGAAQNAPDAVQQAAVALGVTLSAGDYVLIGVQLFLSILIALSLSIILGSLTNDIKAIQSVIMPLMFMLLIPYMLSIFIDINTLPVIPRILLYIIPFTHSFIASSNLYLDNYLLTFIGVGYQAVFLFISITVATALFNSDKIFTLSLNFNKKRKIIKQN